MTFIPQINLVELKCKKALNILKFLCGTWWGSDPSTLTTLYKSLIRSIIDYGSYVYFSNRKATENILEGIQISSLKIALGYRRSTPDNVVIAESKVTTIRDRSEYLGNCYLAKVLSNQNSVTSKNIKSFLNISNKYKKEINSVFGQCLVNIDNWIHKIHSNSNYSILTSIITL